IRRAGLRKSPAGAPDMDPSKQREDLVAYVDGELPAAEAREIESWLAGDAEARERRRHLQEDALVLRGLFGAVLREPVPAALSAAIGAAKAGPARTRGRELLQRSRRRAIGTLLAAAAMACLIIGGVGGFLGGRYEARREGAAVQPLAPNWIMQ